VEKLLREQGVTAYLPLMSVYRRWSDRMKKVEVPLFNSYLFVRTHPVDQNHYYNILHTPGVVRFISFEGQPVPVPDHQIEALQRLSAEGYDLTPVEKPLLPGTPVEIKQGPLKGIRGEVVQNRQKPGTDHPPRRAGQKRAGEFAGGAGGSGLSSRFNVQGLMLFCGNIVILAIYRYFSDNERALK
jgi:transcriptional antiterminator RfaH